MHNIVNVGAFKIGNQDSISTRIDVSEVGKLIYNLPNHKVDVYCLDGWITELAFWKEVTHNQVIGYAET